MKKFRFDYRLANIALSYAKYLGKTFWPAKLIVFYPYSANASRLDDLPVLMSALLLAAVSLVVLLCLKRYPWFATGWFWFLGTLVPVIGIIQSGGQAMADRFTYIPLIGVFLGLVLGCD